MMMALRMLVACGLVAAGIAGVRAETSPFAGTELDQAFASGRIDAASLHNILADIGRLQGELRYTHLKYHLAVRGVLSLDQIASYDRLRGYDTARAPAPGMHGRHSH